jgi:hypothetical protein
MTVLSKDRLNDIFGGNLLQYTMIMVFAFVQGICVGCKGDPAALDLAAIIYPERIIERGILFDGELNLPPNTLPEHRALFGMISDNANPDKMERVDWVRGIANIYIFPSDIEAEAAYANMREGCCPQSDRVTFSLSAKVAPSDFLFMIEGNWQYEVQFPPVENVPLSTPSYMPLDVQSYTVVIHECRVVASLFSYGTKAEEQDYVAYAEETRKRIRANLCNDH